MGNDVPHTLDALQTVPRCVAARCAHARTAAAGIHLCLPLSDHLLTISAKKNVHQSWTLATLFFMFIMPQPYTCLGIECTKLRARGRRPLEPFARSRQPPAPPRVAPGPGPRTFFFSARTASSDPSDCVPRIPNQPCWGAAAGVWRRGFSTTNYPLPVGTERPGARRD